MDNTNYVNVNPLPDEAGGVNCKTQEGNTDENQNPAVETVKVEGNETSDTSTESVSDEEATAKAQELMRLISDPNVLKAYRNIRSDVYGKKRTQVSKKDVKKKKAKRRMAKKSRRG
jgi:hypothetical protein